jgi:two-component system nitrate/nitrite response regulator NarL
MRTSTLLLVGCNKLSRLGLKSLLTSSPFTVIGEVSDITQIDPDVLPEPDIALLDCTRESRVVLELLEGLHAIYPDTPAVILSENVSIASLAACLSAGAAGFLTTDISLAALLRSLQLAALGETVFPTDLAGLLVSGKREQRRPFIPVENACGLSEREVETVQCLIRGDSNKVIARRLNITEATIKVHIKSVLRKIKASNRTQAAIWALGQGYLPAPNAAPATAQDHSV